MLLCLLLSIAAAHQSQVQLEFKPPVGKSYRYAMSMAMRMDLPAMGQTKMAPMKMTITTDMDMKIIKRTGDLTTIETRMSSPNISTPAGSPLGEMLKKSVAKTGGEKTGRSEIDKHFTVHQISSFGSGSGSGAGFSGAFEGISFPSHPLKVGDSWTATMDLSKLVGAMGAAMPGKGTLKMKYTLEAIERMGNETDALLGVTTDTMMPISAMGQSFNVHLVAKGTSSLDVATGMFRSTKMNMDMDMAVQGQKIRQHMVQSLIRK